MSTPLPTYLRTFRRRCGYTQDELSFLLGVASDQAVSRLERRHANPSAKVLIATEVIFNTRPDEVFPLLHQDVKAGVLERARSLEMILRRRTASPERDRKLVALSLIADRRGVPPDV